MFLESKMEKQTSPSLTRFSIVDGSTSLATSLKPAKRGLTYPVFGLFAVLLPE